MTAQFFIETLKKYGIEFFTGVPDSLLKSVCAYISDNVDARHNIIAANEGGAVALASGYHLATGKIGLVYMQNSGEGNTINPLVSLADKDVYNIPILLLIGWRGEPGKHDEPQHLKQGKVTTGILNTLGINYDVLSQDETTAAKQIEKAFNFMSTTNEVYALIVKKDTFDQYTLKNNANNGCLMTREEAIQIVASCIEPKDCIVSTTGMISRELFEYRTATNSSHERDFLTVGSMGHASQIALGIAIEKEDRRVWCFDGDGACIMHMGNMAILASLSPTNYIHVVFNNGAHDSVGGQPTVGQKISITGIAKAVGYNQAHCVNSKEGLTKELDNLRNAAGPILLEIMVKKGNRKDLGRPTTTPVENKKALMEFLQK